jgi:glycosyltransferase involved in cell wall biosynthesis
VSSPLNCPTPDQITIAVTVFERTDYILGAIESALNQTIPVKVIVVEDCANSTRVRDAVLPAFGERVQYFRNPVRRGIFGNWNACCEYAGTEWVSILHDDDFLHPEFVEGMLALGRAAGPMGAYFSRTVVLDENGDTALPGSYDFPAEWRTLDLPSFARHNLVLFPGQLLNVSAIRRLGGFREYSQFAGDWDMWFRLAFDSGAAQTRQVGATVRVHNGLEKGTNRVVRNGRKLGLDFIQCRRNLSLLRQRMPEERATREEFLKDNPTSSRDMFSIIPGLSARMTHYQWGLLLRSTPPSFWYALVQRFAACLGPHLLRKAASQLRRFTQVHRLF